MIFNKFKLTKNITKFLILFLAICFVINAMHILFLAGNHSVPQIHGYMNYNDDENFYTVDDLVIGDYIENFGHYMADGQNTWRVVDKTEDGILLRYDRAFDHIFDAPRPLGDPNRLPYNSVLSWTNGGEFPYNRESDGSNFWYESDLRGFLNGEFFEHFSEGEQNLIASVKQTQTFWRGENNSEFEDKQFGTISVATHSQVTGGTEQHVNRMDMLFLDEFNPGEQSMGMASTTDDHSKNYANLATYNIYDKVFIWDLIQAESISHSDLRNQNGLRYARGIDFEGNPVFTWTRTPFMEHGNNKGISGSALVLTGSISERTGIDMGVEAANTVRIPEGNGIYDHTSIGVLPMVYLDNSVVLSFSGQEPYNPNEVEVPRPTIVQGVQDGYMAFSVKDSVDFNVLYLDDNVQKIEIPYMASLERTQQILAEYDWNGLNPGYDFIALYKDSQFGTLFNPDDLPEYIVQDYDLYAKMAQVEYSITIKMDMPIDIVNPNMDDEQVITLHFGEKIADKIDDPVSESHDFVNWYFDDQHLQVVDTSQDFNLGDDFLSKLDGYKSEIGKREFCLYGNWQIKNFEVVVYVNDDTEQILDIHVQYGTTLGDIRAALYEDYSLEIQDFFLDADHSSKLSDEEQVKGDTIIYVSVVQESIQGDNGNDSNRPNYFWQVFFILLFFSLILVSIFIYTNRRKGKNVR